MSYDWIDWVGGPFTAEEEHRIVTTWSKQVGAGDPRTIRKISRWTTPTGLTQHTVKWWDRMSAEITLEADEPVYTEERDFNFACPRCGDRLNATMTVTATEPPTNPTPYSTASEKRAQITTVVGTTVTIQDGAHRCFPLLRIYPVGTIVGGTYGVGTGGFVSGICTMTRSGNWKLVNVANRFLRVDELRVDEVLKMGEA